MTSRPLVLIAVGLLLAMLGLAAKGAPRVGLMLVGASLMLVGARGYSNQRK